MVLNRTPNIDCYRVGAVPKIQGTWVGGSDQGLGTLGCIGFRPCGLGIGFMDQG